MLFSLYQQSRFGFFRYFSVQTFCTPLYVPIKINPFQKPLPHPFTPELIFRTENIAPLFFSGKIICFTPEQLIQWEKQQGKTYYVYPIGNNYFFDLVILSRSPPPPIPYLHHAYHVILQELSEKLMCCFFLRIK